MKDNRCHLLAIFINHKKLSQTKQKQNKTDEPFSSAVKMIQEVQHLAKEVGNIVITNLSQLEIDKVVQQE